MNTIQIYNDLDNSTVTRGYLRQLITVAKKNNQPQIVHTLSALLKSNPEVKIFEIELDEKIKVKNKGLGNPTAQKKETIGFNKENLNYQKTQNKGLNASRHTGLAKEGLNDCGRLKKGYKYEKGGVIVRIVPPKFKKLEKKTEPNKKPKATEPNKEPITKSKFKPKRGKSVQELFRTWIKYYLNIDLTKALNLDLKPRVNYFNITPSKLKPHDLRNLERLRHKKNSYFDISIDENGYDRVSISVTQINKIGIPKSYYNQTKKKPKATEKEKKALNGLNNIPVIYNPEVNVNVTNKSKKVNNRYKTASDRTNSKAENTFRLNGDIGQLMGELQDFRLLIALRGDTHAGKSEFVKQLANEFLNTGRTVAFYDLEQGGMDSKDTVKSIDRNINKTNQNRLFVTGEANYNIINEDCENFDVVVIDSWQKLKLPNTKLDDLRINHPKTIFIIIFQQNGTGGTRGGVAADFDSPVIVKVHRVDNTFKNNYAEILKNRGNVLGGMYNLFNKKYLGNPNEPTNEIKEEIIQIIDL